MKCLLCGETTEVMAQADFTQDGIVVRTRRCLGCGKKFVTREVVTEILEDEKGEKEHGKQPENL